MAFQSNTSVAQIVQARKAAGESWGARAPTVSSSPVAAKLAVGRWRASGRPSGAGPTEPPAPFAAQRDEQAGRFDDWGQRLATTSMGIEFQAPPPPEPTVAADGKPVPEEEAA
jgi:hypothetical protein